MKNNRKFRCRGWLAGILAVLLLASAIPAHAYLALRARFQGAATIGINVMFDNLTTDALKKYQDAYNADPKHPSPLPEDKNDIAYEWGHRGNPYVISQDRHLTNLQVLQNNGVLSSDEQLTDDNRPCFVVSTPDYQPVVIGNGMTIDPVGVEKYPFVGTLEGVTGTATTLTGGTKINQSAFHNVTISASGGEPDIGFFAKVSNGAVVQNMTFSDVKIQVGNSLFDRLKDKLHTWFSTLSKSEPKTDPGETNHLGIIAGHVENATMRNLSVYYSSVNVPAVTLNGHSASNYLCGTGFFGLLDRLNVDETHPDGWGNEDFGGSSSEGGGQDSGAHPGYVRAEQMFQYKPSSVGPDDAVQLRELIDQEGKSLAQLSEDGKLFIHDGVFSFTLSKGQDDIIENIWPKSEQTKTLSFAEVMAAMDMLGDGTESYTSEENSATPEGAAPAAKPESPENSATGTEIVFPDASAPETDAAEKEVQVTFFKNPEDLKLTIWRMVGQQKEYQVSIADMESLIMTTEEPTQAQIAEHLKLEEGSLIRQAQVDPEQPNLYLLPPDDYFLNAEREGYVPVEAQSFTVDKRSDSMKIQLNMEPLEDAPTNPPTTPPTNPPTEPPTTPPTNPPTEPPTTPPTTPPTMPPTDPPTEPPTTPPTDPPAEAPEQDPAGTEAPVIEGDGVVCFAGEDRVLPDLYFGTEGGIRLYHAASREPVTLSAQNSEPTVPETTVPETETPIVGTPGTGATGALESPYVQGNQQEPSGVYITCQPKDAQIKFGKIPDWGEIKYIEPTGKTVNGNSVTYYFDVRDGRYQYTVLCPGYIPQENLSIGHWNPVTHVGPIVLKEDPNAPKPQEVTFNCVPEDLTFEFWKQGAPDKKFTCDQSTRTQKLLPGKYFYTASHAGYHPAPDNSSFEIKKGQTNTVDISLKSAGTKVTFKTTPQDLSFTFWKDGDAAHKITCNSGNRTQNLAPGKYHYKASHKGYTMKSGIFTVQKQAEQSIEIKLKPQGETADVLFQCQEEINSNLVTLTIQNQQGETVYSGAPGTCALEVNKSYTWTAEGFGYEKTQPQTLKVVKNPKPVTIALNKLPTAAVTFVCDPADAELTIHCGELKMEPDPANPYLYHLPAGNTYTWRASKTGYNAASGTVEITGAEAQTITLDKLSNTPMAHVVFEGLNSGDSVEIVNEYGRKMDPAPDGSFQLPQGNYSYRIVRNGKSMPGKPLEITHAAAISGKTVTVTAANDGKDHVTNPNYQIPAEGAVPSMKPVENTAADNKITLAPKADWVYKDATHNQDVVTDMGVTGGRYHIYLRKVTNLNQIHSGSGVADSRYFICPSGYDGLTAGQKPAYLATRLGGSQTEFVGAFYAIAPEQCEITIPTDKQKGDMVMSFTTPEKRAEAIANLGLQLEPVSNSRYNIFQSVYQNGDWVPKYYLGLGSLISALWNHRIVRTVGKNPPADFDSEIYNIQITGNGAFMLQGKTDQERLRYIKPGTDGSGTTKDNIFDVTGNGSDTMSIYQIVGYEESAVTEGKWVVARDKNPIRLDAGKYVFKYSHPATGDGNKEPAAQPNEYDLIRIESLGQMGWKQSSNVPINAGYRPTKMFSLRSASMREGQHTGPENPETVVALPLNKAKPQDKFVIPFGSLGFFVTGEAANKDNLFVRTITLAPRSTDVFTGSLGPISRIGIWPAGQGSTGRFPVYAPRLSVPVPVSQPQTLEHSYPITVHYEGKTYTTYMQGEIYLIASEISVTGLASNTGTAFFLAESNRPMQLVYCAAEGIADGETEPESGGNGTIQLGNIDFVYEKNGVVAHVQHPAYTRSGVLFRFNNLDNSGGAYPDINQGIVNIWRQATGPKITWKVTDYNQMTFGVTEKQHDVLDPEPVKKQ